MGLDTGVRGLRGGEVKVEDIASITGQKKITAVPGAVTLTLSRIYRLP
jgi:hypothetical protein